MDFWDAGAAGGGEFFAAGGGAFRFGEERANARGYGFGDVGFDVFDREAEAGAEGRAGIFGVDGPDEGVREDDGFEGVEISDGAFRRGAEINAGSEWPAGFGRSMRFEGHAQNRIAGGTALGAEHFGCVGLADEGFVHVGTRAWSSRGFALTGSAAPRIVRRPWEYRAPKDRLLATYRGERLA